MRPGWRAALWMALPAALYLALLRHFWFNAPVWDDYDAILNAVIAFGDARSPREWLTLLFNQHNEHRVATTRLAAWAMAKLFGGIDFRALVLLGNLSWFGILYLLWLEFRDSLAPPFFAAAGFLLLQTSYFEASLLSMAALSNIGTLLLAFASLRFALREGAHAAAASVVLAAVASATQASGLFALPLAFAACVATRRWPRAALFAIVSALLWLAYFHGYYRPPNHPSPLVALSHPVETLELFLMVLGAIASALRPAMAAGLVLVGALAWLAVRRSWRAHPAVALWILFILASAAAASVGRVGLGVFYASRYAIYSSCLVAMVFLLIVEARGSWNERQARRAALAGALGGLAIVLASWPFATEYSFRARLLAKAVPMDPAVRAEPWFGVLYPNLAWARGILVRSEERGLWTARERALYPSDLRFVASAPSARELAGYVDRVEVEGPRVSIHGWSHIPATLRGRAFTVVAPAPLKAAITPVERIDVAASIRHPDLLYSGFRIDADYDSEARARQAAADLCVFAEGADHDARMLGGAAAGCRRSGPSDR